MYSNTATTIARDRGLFTLISDPDAFVFLLSIISTILMYNGIFDVHAFSLEVILFGIFVLIFFPFVHISMF